jgi:hypothetical protein
MSANVGTLSKRAMRRRRKGSGVHTILADSC